MTPADKELIRQAIMRATKLPLGEIYPEAFIDKNRGALLKVVDRDDAMPNMMVAFAPLNFVPHKTPLRNVRRFGLN
jgi:hypothetical protein